MKVLIFIFSFTHNVFYPITLLWTKSITKKEMNKCMAEIYDPGWAGLQWVRRGHCATLVYVLMCVQIFLDQNFFIFG